jgi:hypothetical protein
MLSLGAGYGTSGRLACTDTRHRPQRPAHDLVSRAEEPVEVLVSFERFGVGGDVCF